MTGDEFVTTSTPLPAGSTVGERVLVALQPAADDAGLVLSLHDNDARHGL